MIEEIEDAFYIKNPNFKKMMKIISEYQNNPALDVNCERHHIVPRSFYRNQGLPTNGLSENLVKLPFNMHMVVHFYAAQCAKPIIKDSMLRAMNNFFKLKGVNEAFVLEHQEEFQNARNVMKGSSAWFEWAKENDPENYQRYLDHKFEKDMKIFKKKLFPKPEHYKGIKYCLNKLRRISKRLSEEPKKKTVCYKKVICINTGEIFDSVGDAGRKMGLSGAGISTLCQHSGRHKTVKGFFFEYLENYDPNKVYEVKTSAQVHGKPVYCFETKKTYESIGEASRQTGCNPTGISDCCKGKLKSIKGCHFIFEGEKKES